MTVSKHSQDGIKFFFKELLITFRSISTDYPSSFHTVYRKNILIIKGLSYGKNKMWLN
jgi:hypothetical protein